VAYRNRPGCAIIHCGWRACCFFGGRTRQTCLLVLAAGDGVRQQVSANARTRAGVGKQTNSMSRDSAFGASTRWRHGNKRRRQAASWAWLALLCVLLRGVVGLGVRTACDQTTGGRADRQINAVWVNCWWAITNTSTTAASWHQAGQRASTWGSTVWPLHGCRACHALALRRCVGIMARSCRPGARRQDAAAAPTVWLRTRERVALAWEPLSGSGASLPV
jgi:hypothetical protein